MRLRTILRAGQTGLAGAAGALVALAGAARAEVPKDDLVVHIYDVGQGSCVLIECPDGPPILDDCGKIGGGGHSADAASRIRGRLDELRTAYPTPLQVLISHPHIDHYSVLVSSSYRIPADDVRRLYWAGPWDSFSVPARKWIDDLAERIDGARHNGACVADARVACLSPNEHQLATPRLECGKAQADLLAADAYSFNVAQGASAQSAQGSSPNGESAVLRIRYAGRSLVLAGDAEQVTQLYAAQNAAALGAPLDRTTVLLLPHHGSSEYGSNDAPWAAATRPQVVVASANIGGNYGHPSCEALEVFDALSGPDREMARLPAPITVRCGKGKARPHESVMLSHQFLFTETEGEVTIRVGPTGDLRVTCEHAGPACAATP